MMFLECPSPYVSDVPRGDGRDDDDARISSAKTQTSRRCRWRPRASRRAGTDVAASLLAFEDRLGAVAEPASAPPPPTSNDDDDEPDVWDILEKEVDELVARREGREVDEKKDDADWGLKTVQRALEDAVNDEAVASSFAEALASAFDVALRTSEKIDGLLRLFRLTRSKDVFEANYRADLGLRLLERLSREGASPSDLEDAVSAERAALTAFEAECGASFVGKLEGARRRPKPLSLSRRDADRSR